jgi:hypothetical protein
MRDVVIRVVIGCWNNMLGVLQPITVDTISNFENIMKHGLAGLCLDPQFSHVRHELLCLVLEASDRTAGVLQQDKAISIPGPVVCQIGESIVHSV